MTKKELQDRTKSFAIKIIRLCQALDNKITERIIVGQLIRSSSSIAANYRAACRAKSYKDFILKISIVCEECDESLFWLEILGQLVPGKKNEIDILANEANQLTSIFSSTLKTSRMRIK